MLHSLNITRSWLGGTYHRPKVSILESVAYAYSCGITKIRVSTYFIDTYQYSYAVDIYWGINSGSTQDLFVSSVGALNSQMPSPYPDFDTDGHSGSVEIDVVANSSQFRRMILSSSVSATTAILSNLTANKIPYQTAAGLTDSPIAVTGNDVSTAGNLTLSSADGTFMQIGAGRLVWDNTNNAIKVIKADGTAANFYATGSNSAQGIGRVVEAHRTTWYLTGRSMWLVVNCGLCRLSLSTASAHHNHIGDHASAGEKMECCLQPLSCDGWCSYDIYRRTSYKAYNHGST